MNCFAWIDGYPKMRRLTASDWTFRMTDATLKKILMTTPISIQRGRELHVRQCDPNYSLAQNVHIFLRCRMLLLVLPALWQLHTCLSSALG
jgi:hypothetical protein